MADTALAGASESLPQHQQPQQEEQATATTNYVSMELGQADDANGGQAEKQDDAKSVVSSVLTADGIHDPVGFACVCLVILVGDMSRGVMFPSLWPLVSSFQTENIDSGALQGLCVAAFSLGRILVSPFFGRWSMQVGYTRTLQTSTAILCCGTILYAQCYRVGRPSFLLLTQTVLGCGSGTLGVTRAFVAEVTAQRSRTTYLAWITAVQYAGFTVTPCIGAACNWIFSHSKNASQESIFALNMYTAPAYVMAAMTFVTFLVLTIYFPDRQRLRTKKDASSKSQRRTQVEKVANTITWTGLSIYDLCLAGCMLLNITTKGSIASFETLGVALAESHFNWTHAGLTVSLSGTVGVCLLLHMRELSKRWSDTQLIAGGMVVMAAGIAILTTLKENENVVFVNPVWKYVTAIFLIYGIGYPVGHTAVIGMFSKIVGRRPQGLLQGWFASAGSLARMIFPIVTGLMLGEHVRYLFVTLTIVLIVATSVVQWQRETLTLLSM